MRLGVLLPALGIVAALVTGCSSGDVEREPGDPVTARDAAALAGLLHRDYVHGGAAFVVTAPYGKDTVLTLTGEVDFRHAVGQARAVTSFGEGRADDVRAVVFTDRDLWVGGVPGLPEALAADGVTGAAYLHRPLAGGEGDATPLLDAALGVLLNLSAHAADESRSFLGAGYTWQGQRSIDSRLNSLFALPGRRTVAVDASNDLLTQFVTPLPDQAPADKEHRVTVTLADHRPRALQAPDPAQSAEVTEHPDLAAFGL